MNFNGQQCDCLPQLPLVSSASLVMEKRAHLHCLREAVVILSAELIICQGTQWVLTSINTYMTEKKKIPLWRLMHSGSLASESSV